MDSPESSKLTTTPFACETAPLPDSPVFSFLSNLSPIQPVKAPPVRQDFPGLNSPPLVFTSPRLNLQSQPTSLKRAHYPITSLAKFREQLDDSKNSATYIKGNEKLDIQLSTRVVAPDDKATDSNSSVDDLIQSPSGSHEQFLEAIGKVESPDSKFSFDSTIKTSEQTDLRIVDLTCSKEILEKLEYEHNTESNEEAAVAPPVVRRQSEVLQNENILINVSAVENVLKQEDGVSVEQSTTIGHELPAVNALVYRDEDDFTTELQNAETGLAAALDQPPCILTGSKANGKEIENFVATTGETLTQPTEYQNDLKAFQNRGVHRRCLQFEDAEHSVICNRPAQDSSDSVSATTDGSKPESHGCVPVGTAMVLPNDSVILNSNANQLALGNKRKKTEKGSGLEVINNLSPKKKRINAMDIGGGCRRCNCKRSKCLKLYCDCFAAGIYCVEPCSCQECFNRLAYKDKVIEARQKIEARDPFAFAPRVVKKIIEQPTVSCGEDGSNYTPASARHKKGCKCKKSLCLKKYCECYQANVGCSDGCRCEGCKNVYGQKEENVMIKVALTGEKAQETTDASFVENWEMAAASGSHTYHPEFVNPQNLIPPTPVFQFSNHGKEASKAWFPSGKYTQTPESGFTYVPRYVTPLGIPKNSINNFTIPESANDDRVRFDQESHHGNADTVDEFSVAYPQSGKMEHLSDISDLQKWAQSFPTKRNYLSGTSLVRLGSPITPMGGFGGMQEAEFDGLLNFTGGDDTPEILKNNSTPLNMDKVRSPNKKRVSPPHHELSSSSSVGIRTSKFTLKGVPSFPPLTPCIDSKTPGMQQHNHSHK